MVEKEDRLAKFRKKPLSRRNIYRPQPWYASMGEAKEIFKVRYDVRGFQVIRVTRRDYHFIVSFGENKNGKGKGPSGLKYTICNWPYVYDLPTVDEAKERLMEEGILKRPKKKKVKRRKKRRKK